jgi:hypothetical protein
MAQAAEFDGQRANLFKPNRKLVVVLVGDLFLQRTPHLISPSRTPDGAKQLFCIE